MLEQPPMPDWRGAGKVKIFSVQKLIGQWRSPSLSLGVQCVEFKSEARTPPGARGESRESQLLLGDRRGGVFENSAHTELIDRPGQPDTIF